MLESPLDKCADEGIGHIETMNVLRVQPLCRFGTPVEIVRLFGGRIPCEQAVPDLEAALYELGCCHHARIKTSMRSRLVGVKAGLHQAGDPSF